MSKIHSEIVTQSFNPFWSAATVKERSKINPNVKKTFNYLWKFFKICLFLFITVVGLWGCTQNYSESWTVTNPKLGVGLEVGYSYGTTGDYRYDLMTSNSGPYFTFSDYELSYGPFLAWFVWPATQIVLPIIYQTRVPLNQGIDYGFNTILGILVLLFIIRLITIGITLNSTLNTERMGEVQGKIAEINAKYKNANDSQSKKMKQIEMMQLYRKHKIKPAALFVQAFITIPIFLIVFKMVSLTRPIKATVLFSIWDLSVTPGSQIISDISHNWVYIFFVLLVVPMQIISQWLPQRWATKRNRNAKTTSQKGLEQLKKTRRIQWIMICVFAFFPVITPSAVGLYWFLNSIFTILQSYITHVFIIKRRQKTKTLSKLDQILNRELD
ncbi:membrane protein insertase YidC [Mycoplasma bradburyae]|uniref:Membrane protein insertase YidC n=1 Tax=Mycoplasma bradburyae TaxID=2963128 RepID=A0AAW6HNK0_9MOLU|nr:membrane protein insertase YidC [Mycoplasma bradburyae]MDC4163222.1 membrane protein insertase YidC [Mycoplasma bradburyae]MDC4181836.1 membrane protein insertase YidC [Mycoplasma bradburyae]MDC4182537.1 membrane protein insertase YidC [Mycoplasma bradburyae]MDC4183211.1 membrane protein insertase YidC [Mycoplasma bradburyae]MDC4184019.1 membrane protein insertase YidC [Mycoplasma bradburyae]